MYSVYDHNHSPDAAGMDHTISDDDDVVDPQQPHSRNSSPERSCSKVNNRGARNDQDNIDKSMASSLSSSTFSSAASQRDSIYSLARSSTVASSIHDQNSPGSENETRKRWSAGSLSSIDDIIMSPQKMSLLHVKSASNSPSTMTSNTLDSIAVQSQMDMRRTNVPNRTIMSVLDHGKDPEHYYYHPRTRSSSHDSENELKVTRTNSSSHSSSDSSTTTSKGRLSWTSQCQIPVTMSGWLLKHNATHFTFTTPWKRYYYVLVDNALHEYKTDKSDSPHRDQLDLSSDTLVFINEGFPGKSYVLEIRKPGRRMCLQCTNAENMRQWLHYLKQSIAQVKRSNSIQRSASMVDHAIGQISQHKTPSPPINENTSQPNMQPTHTPPIKSQTSQVTEPLTKKLSRTSSKLNELPPQLPPPSRSPPPVPNA